MGKLLQTVRRAKRWPVKDPIRDARECPDCAAAVYGDKGQEQHRLWHERQLDWQEQVMETLEQIVRKSGLNAVQPGAAGEIGGLDPMEDEQYGGTRRVSWSALLASRADGGDDYQRVSLTDDEADDDDS